MVHLSSFEAVHYRGTDGLSLSPLTRVNLITGSNGIGKTALLEAIWLFGNRYSPESVWHRDVQRSDRPVIDPIAELSGGTLELQGTENGSKHQLKVTFQSVSHVAQTVDNTGPAQVMGHLEAEIDGEPPAKDERYKHLKSVYPTPPGVVLYDTPLPPEWRRPYVIEGTRWQHETPDEYMQRYSDLVRRGRKQDLSNAMGLLSPGLTGVEILTENGRHYMLATTEAGDQRPLKDLGGGIIRLFRLYLSIDAAREGVMLVDEVENGIHYSVFEDIWQRIRDWTNESRVQLVATTHSAECIDAAMEAFADNPEDLSIHKIFENEDTGQIRAVTFSGEALEGARELNWEVR